jgi:hypothetical protein
MKLKILILLYACFCCITAEQRPQAAEPEQERFSSIANKSPNLFTGLLFRSVDFRKMLCSQAEIFKLTKMESCLVDWGEADPIPRVVHIAKDAKVENVMDEVMSPLSSYRHHQLRLVKRNKILQSPTNGITNADAKDFLMEPVEPGDIFVFASRY